MSTCVLVFTNVLPRDCRRIPIPISVLSFSHNKRNIYNGTLHITITLYLYLPNGTRSEFHPYTRVGEADEQLL